MNKVKLFLLAAITSIFFIGCEKNKLPSPEGELVTQNFSIQPIVDDILKDFNPDVWVYNFNTTVATLTLTSTTNPSLVYTRDVSILDLQNGNVNIVMNTGNYSVEYLTTHTQSPNVITEFWTSSSTPHPIISDVIDVGILQNVEVTGTPTTLTGYLDDFMLVCDIPDVFDVCITIEPNFSSSQDRISLINDEGIDAYYGYLNQLTTTNIAPLYLNIIWDLDGNGIINTLDRVLIYPFSGYDKGKVYHYTSNFDNAIIIDIPGFEVETILITN